MSLQVIQHTGQNLKQLEEIKSSKIDGIIINNINNNIYHMVCDIFQHLILFCENGNKLDCPIYLLNQKNYQLASFYNFFTENQVLQIPKSPILSTSGKTVMLESLSIHPSAKYFPLIKNHFRKNTPVPIDPPDKVFIIQRKSHRIMTNLDKLISLVKDILNIDPVLYYPEDHSPEEQIETFKTVKLLICAHGASITNTLFMQDNTNVIEILPPIFRDQTYPRFITALNSDINLIQINHDIPQEYIHRYPKDIVEILSHSKDDPAKLSQYRRGTRDAAYQDGYFKVDENKFKKALLNSIKSESKKSISLI